MDNISVAELNGNLIVPYWMAGDEKHSGLSIVGTNDIDLTISAIFDHQKLQGEQPRLVNVPDFVIANIQYPELFKFKEEKGYNEYVYDMERFYHFNKMPFYWRRKVQRKLDRVGDVSIVRSLDFEDPDNRKLILDAMVEWSPKGINDLGKIEMDSLRTYVEHSAELDVENACLFVDGKLHGFCI